MAHLSRGRCSPRDTHESGRACATSRIRAATSTPGSGIRCRGSITSSTTYATNSADPENGGRPPASSSVAGTGSRGRKWLSHPARACSAGGSSTTTSTRGTPYKGNDHVCRCRPASAASSARGAGAWPYTSRPHPTRPRGSYSPSEARRERGESRVAARDIRDGSGVAARASRYCSTRTTYRNGERVSRRDRHREVDDAHSRRAATASRSARSGLSATTGPTTRSGVDPNGVDAWRDNERPASCEKLRLLRYG